MANSSQAKKRARQNKVRRLQNFSRKTAMRTYIKNTKKAIAKNDASVASKMYLLACKALDRAVNKKLIHKNKASRHKSRLNEQIKNLEKK